MLIALLLGHMLAVGSSQAAQQPNVLFIAIDDLTTYAKDNHSLRGERFRYIRYQDGSEELYDHHGDPNEWTNLAGNPAYAETIARFKKLLPISSAPYHEATDKKPVNAWFAEHLRLSGVTD
jgi:hypothetical protein